MQFIYSSIKSMEIKLEISKVIFNKTSFSKAVKNETSICSMIFIVENINFLEEQGEIDLILSFFSSFLQENPDFYKEKGVLKVIESVVCCFPYEKTREIREISLSHFDSLIHIREGYFLLRGIFKITKDSKSQQSLVSIIKSRFDWLVGLYNGSLLCKCLIFNFPLEEYIHKKNCSDHMDDNIKKNVPIKTLHKDIKYNKHNIQLRSFFSLVLENLRRWKETCFKQLISFGLKNSHGIFEEMIVNLSLVHRKYELFECLYRKFNDYTSCDLFNLLVKSISKENSLYLSFVFKIKYMKQKVESRNVQLKLKIKEIISENHEEYKKFKAKYKTCPNEKSKLKGKVFVSNDEKRNVNFEYNQYINANTNVVVNNMNMNMYYDSISNVSNMKYIDIGYDQSFLPSSYNYNYNNYINYINYTNPYSNYSTYSTYK